MSDSASRTSPTATSEIGRSFVLGLGDRLGSLAWTVVPLSIGLASRVFSAIVLGITGDLAGTRHPIAVIGGHSPFTDWDAQWYLSIATRGYHALPLQRGDHHDLAFFPAWPLLMRISTFDVLPIGVVAPLVANVLAVLAIILIWRLLAGRFGETVATNASLLFAFSPAAYVLSMAYSEPLYLVLAAAAFLAAGRRSGVFATGAAMLARVGGVALIASTGVGWLLTRGRERWRLLAIGAGVVALAAWALVVALVTHDPLGFVHDGSSNWANPSGYRALLQTLHHPSAALMARVLFLGLVGVGALGVLRYDRELGIYSLISLGLALLPGGLVVSYPRYALAAFPAFAGLGGLLTERRFPRLTGVAVVLLTVGFAAFQAFLVWDAFLAHKLQAP